MIDPITGRQVPAVVFLQNTMLLQEFIKDKLELDQEANRLLKARAEATEYLYNLFKQEGVSAQIDSDIGIDFIDFDATREVSASSMRVTTRPSGLSTS